MVTTVKDYAVLQCTLLDAPSAAYEILWILIHPQPMPAAEEAEASIETNIPGQGWGN